MFLLDINILIALADADHPHHDRAAAFFLGIRQRGWSSSPLTENGFLRIIGHPNYPKGPGSPALARRLLDQFCAQPGHQFWPDTLTLRDTKAYPVLPHSGGLTDYYLLALAVKRKGKLATLDRRIDPNVIVGGNAGYFPIP